MRQNNSVSREEKAKQIIARGEFSYNDDGTMTIRGYLVTGTSCECMDFNIRGVTCKHLIAYNMLKAEELQAINYMKLSQAHEFVKIYGEKTLDSLKAMGEVVEEHNHLIWL